MNTVQLREAKARLSELVEAAENGEPTIVTKHGRPAAMVIPFEDGQKLYPRNEPNLIEYLMTMPAEIPIRRNPSRSRKIEF